jgi:hypothetical protein
MTIMTGTKLFFAFVLCMQGLGGQAGPDPLSLFDDVNDGSKDSGLQVGMSSRRTVTCTHVLL